MKDAWKRSSSMNEIMIDTMRGSELIQDEDIASWQMEES